ncbi:MAG: AMP-binding protein [Burkholderiales bacterium]|jgi:long-chain acyl-CoA synthetase|nr:AMP-binding protein [Burkholderiales bacterium]
MNDPATVPEMLARRAARSPGAPAFHALAQDGVMRPSSWSVIAAQAAAVAAALAARGVTTGDRVAILAPTSIEWEVAQLGALQAGACVAGVDPYYPDRVLGAALEAVAPSVIVAESAEAFARVSPVSRDGARLLIALRGAGDERVVPLERLVAESHPPPVRRPRAEDLAIITFSSGTTGDPKPIAYTHAQVVATVHAILAAFPEIDEGAHLLCWLPLANLFQRIIDFCAIERGATSFVVEDPREVMRYVAIANPDLLIGVPRFFEKLQAGIQARFDASPVTARLARWALARGDPARGTLSRMHHALADRILLRKVRAAFGSRLKFFVSGSAPMPTWLLEWFEALGLPVLEAYGVSENIVPLAINTLAARKLGSVGRPLAPNELKVGAEDEIFVRGPGVFAGHLERGVLVPARLTPDGYWPTGDCGTQDAGGFVSLTGRKADLFKLSTGRWVVPAPIEQRLRRSPGVDEAVVLGAGRKVTLAVIGISPETRRRLGGPEGTGALTPREQTALLRGIDAALSDVPAHARPAGLLVTTDPFSVAGGELTSNLKVRRKAVEAKHREAIEALFASAERSHEGTLSVRYT